MAEFSARLGGPERPFDDLLAKLQNPTPVLEELGQRLVADLQEMIEPHTKTGALEEGFSNFSIEQVGPGVWTLGVGDPNILGGWTEKAPPGTIAEFIKWLREQNRLARGKQAKKYARARARYEKRLAIYREKRAQVRRATHEAGLAAKAERRKALRAEFRRTVIGYAKGTIQEEALRSVSRRAISSRLYQIAGRAPYTGIRREIYRILGREPSLRNLGPQYIGELKKGVREAFFSVRTRIRRQTIKTFFK